MLGYGRADFGPGGPPVGRDPMVIAHKVPQYLVELAGVFLEHEPEIVLYTGVCFSNIDHTACMNFVRNAFIIAARRKRIGICYIRQWPESTFPVICGGEEWTVEFYDWTRSDTAARALACHRCQMGKDSYERYLKGKEKALAEGKKRPAAERFRVFINGSEVYKHPEKWHLPVHPYELPGFPEYDARPNPEGRGTFF